MSLDKRIKRMNEDVVNLISDDEDGSSERRLTQLKRADMTNVQGDRHSNEDYSCDVKLEEIRYDHQDSSATTFLGAAFAPKVARDIHKEITDDQQKSSTMLFLRTPPPAKVSLDVQGQEITRQFWKAGDYEIKPPSNKRLLDGMDHVRVHPKFLHSNATSHKWALGAIAELLDNAIDEVANGATFVSIDKVTNAVDGSPALQIHDDGGGMDPKNMRHCMSLGYSHKASNMTIGQYGNGFKTSTMRLGADVIVFSRTASGRRTTQTVGLLSYTFLRATGHEDVVVPMVDFELVDGKAERLLQTNEGDWTKNFSTILQWSPFSTEAELLKQFDDLGLHGTKIIVYNLWMNDDGELELDFETDEQDIQVRGHSKSEKKDSLLKQLTNDHIASRLRFSLRAYASILYLQMPQNFRIILRGKEVEHSSIVDDLKFVEHILYKPNMKDFNFKEVSVITTIGFAKEAPVVNVHGFNVYHKNRLIMPFWKVFQENSSRGKCVVGVLEANFIEPAHDKQDFERTPILQRLETRLKQMTIEYWNLHCHLIGYQAPNQSSKSRSSAPQIETHNTVAQTESRQSELSAPSTPPWPESDALNGLNSITAGKRPIGMIHCDSTHALKRINVSSADSHPYKEALVACDKVASFMPDSGEINVADVFTEIRQLRERCEEYRSREVILRSKVVELETELQIMKAQCEALSCKSVKLIEPKEECK